MEVGNVQLFEYSQKMGGNAGYMAGEFAEATSRGDAGGMSLSAIATLITAALTPVALAGDIALGLPIAGISAAYHSLTGAPVEEYVDNKDWTAPL